MRETWTPERTLELAKMWRAGIPARRIGNALGLSKSAVLGKAHRMGLDPRRPPIAGADQPATVPQPPRANGQNAFPQAAKVKGCEGERCDTPLMTPLKICGFCAAAPRLGRNYFMRLTA